MKNKLFYIALVVVFLAGLSLLLYPTISNAYNAWLQSNVITNYSQQVNQLEQQVFEEQWEKAVDYNTKLTQRDNPYGLPEQLREDYTQNLSVADNGIMAYIEIPSIDVMLPIAHGTSNEVLSRYIGNIEWSSLPVGGVNTHSVISGHRGLPSSELFTNIDHLELGDVFYIHVLGQTLKYQVCHIAVVEPEDQRLLRIEEGQDLVTLVTCTPYGINSHRLLVRGIRTDTQGSDLPVDVQVKNEITAIDVVVLVSVILVAVAVVAFLVVLTGNKKKKGGQQNEKTDP